MKTISLSVSESDYEAFRVAAKRRNRSIASLIREAMTEYRERELAERSVLLEVPVHHGAGRQAGPLPTRSEIHDEMESRIVVRERKA